MNEWSIIMIVVLGFFFFIRFASIFGGDKALAEFNKDQEQYAAIIRKLPKDIVRKLYSSFQEAATLIGTVVPPGDYPDKYMAMFMATKKVMDDGVYGNITENQRQKINEVFKDLKWIIKEYIPAANQANFNLMNSDGLGFDLITNSAADAMLYSAMNAGSKVKGNEKRAMEYRRLVDKQFVGVIEKIKEIV